MIVGIRRRVLPGNADDDGRAAALLSAKDEQIADLRKRRENVLSNLVRVTGDAGEDLLAWYERLRNEPKAAEASRERIAAAESDANCERERVEQEVAAWKSAPFDLDALGFAEKRRVLTDLGAVVRLYPSYHAPR